MPEKWVLKQLQGLPLEVKVLKSQLRIREWYEHYDGNVFVSFSGGKDSTVLAHLVHQLYPDVPIVFSNTGLEYPEIQSFARKMGAEFIRPKMAFSDVISQYGYPIISKEVSEAIWYARKLVIRQEREAREETGKKQSYRRRQMLGQVVKEDGTEVVIKNPGVVVKRYELSGKYVGGDRAATYERYLKESAGEEFVDDRKQKRSMFNKDKWLPLCMETQFLIGSQCCRMMKKRPLHEYSSSTKRTPYIGTLTEESRMREQSWVKHGCNGFNMSTPKSQPMSFWTEQDVLHYIKSRGLEIASVYGDIVCVDENGFEYEPLPGMDCKLKCTGCQRTGCIFCGFGAYLDKEKLSRFQNLAITHPKQYEYCMNGGQWVDNPEYDPTAPAYDGEWKNWNPRKIWVPSKKGLGMKKVFEDCNQLYGKDFIRFE